MSIDCSLRDQRITLEPKIHAYFVDGRCDYISVTTFKNMWFKKPFDVKKASESHIPHGVEHELSNMTSEEVAAMWERENADKRQRGTDLHGWIEEFYAPNSESKCVTNLDYLKLYMGKIRTEGLDLSDLKSGNQSWYNFIKFVSSNGSWELIRSEWRVFHEKYKLAGTLDALFRIPMPDGTYRNVVCDWKRVARLQFTSPFTIGDASAPTFPATNYWEYHIQLNLYRIILEDYYDFKIDYMMIVRLSEKCKSFKIHLIERDEAFRTILESRTGHFDGL
jgi:hypothetical protein